MVSVICFARTDHSIPERGQGLSRLENTDIICITMEDFVRDGSGQAAMFFMPMTEE